MSNVSGFVLVLREANDSTWDYNYYIMTSLIILNKNTSLKLFSRLVVNII